MLIIDLDKGFLLPLPDDGEDGHLLRIIDDDEFMEPLVGHVLPEGDEAAVEAPVGQRIDELLEEGLVADLDRPEEDVQPRLCIFAGLQLLRILPALPRDEGLVMEVESGLLRLRD